MEKNKLIIKLISNYEDAIARYRDSQDWYDIEWSNVEEGICNCIASSFREDLDYHKWWIHPDGVESYWCAIPYPTNEPEDNIECLQERINILYEKLKLVKIELNSEVFAYTYNPNQLKLF